MPDRLDSQDLRDQAWEGFRAAFATAFFWIWTLRDMYDAPINYVNDLREAFILAELNARQLMEDDPEYDGAWPFDNGAGVTFISPEIGALLSEQLIHENATEELVRARLFALASTSVYASLDAYCREIGVLERGHELTNAVDSTLRRHGSPGLDLPTSDLLRRLTAVRHLYMHNRGVADDAYVRGVHNTGLQRGEMVLVGADLAHNFAQAAWEAAAQLHVALKSPA